MPEHTADDSTAMETHDDDSFTISPTTALVRRAPRSQASDEDVRQAIEAVE